MITRLGRRDSCKDATFPSVGSLVDDNSTHVETEHYFSRPRVDLLVYVCGMWWLTLQRVPAST